MAIIKTSNTHQTHLLVAEQIPDFVREDHPIFVEFIEKYYEFLGQANSAILTSDKESYYYGADYAAKVLPDIYDIDTTDLELFIDSFRKQYASRFPEKLFSAVNVRTFYKNLIDFYRARGTEDSFKFLFRLLFNDDDVELYYPKKDMLIASGGNFSAGVDMMVAYADGINNAKGQEIIGSDSGASAVINRVVVMPTEPVLGFKSGRMEVPPVPNDNYPRAGERGLQLNDVFGMGSNREKMSQKTFLVLDPGTVRGKFNIHEMIYVSNVAAGVTNTFVLPSVVETVFLEDFSSYESANNLISFNDGSPSRRESLYAPWNLGARNMAANTNPVKSNTGLWHTPLSTPGEINILTEHSLGQVRGATGLNKRVLQVGNNLSSSSWGNDDHDKRSFVFAKNIPFNADKLYRISVRLRDLQGGRTAEWAADDGSIHGVNQTSAGLVTMTANGQPFGMSGDMNYNNSPSVVLHSVDMDDNWFTYEGYVKGRQTEAEWDAGGGWAGKNDSVASGGSYPYDNEDWGGGGRRDVNMRSTPSLSDALAGTSVLAFPTYSFRPVFTVNYPSSTADSDAGGPGAFGRTQCDFFKIEALDSTISRTGRYVDESSLLSTGGAHLQDGFYRQYFAYDLRSKQDMKDYYTTVRDVVHPAGNKMFGTRQIELVGKVSANDNLLVANNIVPSAISSFGLSPSNYKFYFGADEVAGSTDPFVFVQDGATAPPNFYANVSVVDGRRTKTGGAIEINARIDGTDATGDSSALIVNPSAYVYWTNSTAYSDWDHTTSLSGWIPIEKGKKWIISYYIRTTAPGAYSPFDIGIFTSNSTFMPPDGGYYESISFFDELTDLPTSTLDSTAWARHYGIVDFASETLKLGNDAEGNAPGMDRILPYFMVRRGMGTDVRHYFDGFQIEEFVEGKIEKPSKYPEELILDFINSSENPDSFSPPAIESLAGWWKADAIGPENLQSSTTTNGHHTTTNIVPPGFSSWAELPAAPFVTASLSAGDYVVKPNALKVDTGATESASFPHKMFFNSANTNDEHLNSGNSYNGIISPNKSWLLSFYTKTTNNDIGLSGQNGQVSIVLGNTSSGNTVSNTYNVTTSLSLPAHGANLYSADWERIAMKYDLSANPEQKFQLVFKWDNPNTTNYIDGVMLEEYKGSLTPSSYAHPSFNSSNVMSWYDLSTNRINVYANTSMVYGTQWAPPQYIANTGMGHPAVRFRSNTAWQAGHSTGNVYHYSSFPPDNNYTTGLNGTISPSANTLPRPIANQFTGFVVARTNLNAYGGLTGQYWNDDYGHDSHLSFFQTGAISANAEGGMTSGTYDLRILSAPAWASNTGFLSTYVSNTTGHGSHEFGAYAAPDTNGDGARDLVRGAAASGLPLPGPNNSFSIFGMSESASAFNDYDLLTFHHNGRRWGNDSIFFSSRDASVVENLPTDLSTDRLDYDQQVAYNSTFSIGYQQKENYQFANSTYAFFDGDIAEIVWYNRQLSNTQIALVEGYLAHKYGIEDGLIHKDGSGDHPYKYQKPPAIGANNTPY